MTTAARSSAWERPLFTPLLLLGAVLGATGCVSVQHVPLSERDSSGLAGKTLQRSAYAKPSFSAFTTGRAMFGALGAGVMISAGNKIIDDNAVEDPAARIGQEIAEGLSRKYDIRVQASAPGVSESDDVEALAKTYGDADMILDVKTTGWQFIYFPTNFSRYRVLYAARLRLIDRQRRQVMAEELCSYKPEYEDTSKAPTYDELVADNATGLKRELAKGREPLRRVLSAERLRDVTPLCGGTN